ncbi:MAG: 4-hydroxythreonine-4-phosphate dehydrogenase PdxA [Acidobacteriota bacterium]|nr:4-hydroxythreonine-4-phosphate dehydrogenase PdxA [Acidobacteriota bacterium]
MPDKPTSDKPIYGITMGDASGVGPEILLKAFANGEIRTPFVAYGDLAALRFYNERLGYGADLRSIEGPAEYRPAALNVLSPALLQAGDITPGELSGKAGHAAREYVVAATRAALAGEIGAFITLPMNKEATCLTHPGFTGHTELIGDLCGVADVTIMLASDDLIVTHVSTHVSLLNAILNAKRPRIQKIIQLTADAVGKLIPKPRIAVAGLNPHAGEHGLFGNEEIEEIIPAVEWARAQGFPVEGPFPPDTLFYMAVKLKKFDAIVCMYHDQGHIPSKLLDFEGGVNVALGLPIIRTSVDHGTAFDIAGTGTASTRSLIRAIEFAEKMTGR